VPMGGEPDPAVAAQGDVEVEAARDRQRETVFTRGSRGHGRVYMSIAAGDRETMRA